MYYSFRWNLFLKKFKTIFFLSIDSWISALESDRMKQAASFHPSQNVLPSEIPAYAGVVGVRPIHALEGGQVGAAQSEWNFAGSKVTPTTRWGKSHFHDINIIESNAQSIQGSTPSSNQGPGKLPPDNSSPVSPVTSAQGGVNGNSATPPSGNNGANNPTPGTGPNQGVGNQGNEVPGGNSPASSSSPSQVGSTPSSGTNGANGPAPVTSPGQVSGAPSSVTKGANSPAPVTSPNQVGSNQGKEVPVAVSPPAGGSMNPSKAGTSGNSGATAGSAGKSFGLPKNPSQSNGG